ncbi:hypothetical protein M0813_18612 [Anaeramoeba flamelloides]|uniref:Uncharacterized protein n=1 Tax=Anaeramoeba flamelloides TaxID=1746091 RepID=A0ABQ8YR70_9EUKA|nr:hypothetical protein M0813_18612 [Anaeramoeba flamelloides]
MSGFSKVTSYLYFCDSKAIKNFETLYKFGISTIITCNLPNFVKNFTDIQFYEINFSGREKNKLESLMLTRELIEKVKKQNSELFNKKKKEEEKRTNELKKENETSQEKEKENEKEKKKEEKEEENEARNGIVKQKKDENENETSQEKQKENEKENEKKKEKDEKQEENETKNGIAKQKKDEKQKENETKEEKENKDKNENEKEQKKEKDQKVRQNKKNRKEKEKKNPNKKEKIQKVLIVCEDGQDLSPTVVISYLMQTMKETLRKIYHHILKLRPNIHLSTNNFHLLLELDYFINDEYSYTLDEYLHRNYIMTHSYY